MKKSEKIEKFLSELETEIDVLNCVDCDNVESYDDVYNQINENQGFDIEIIYYYRAMEYLMENDNSLQESLELASEMGFDCESLSSETLASILASQNVRIEFDSLESEITDFFDNLEDDFECEVCGEEYETEEEAENCCKDE